MQNDIVLHSFMTCQETMKDYIILFRNCMGEKCQCVFMQNDIVLQIFLTSHKYCTTISFSMENILMYLGTFYLMFR